MMIAKDGVIIQAYNDRLGAQKAMENLVKQSLKNYCDIYKINDGYLIDGIMYTYQETFVPSRVYG